LFPGVKIFYQKYFAIESLEFSHPYAPGVKIFDPKYFAIESLEFSHPYASLQV